jgi:biotin carboxyl carrier protein
LDHAPPSPAPSQRLRQCDTYVQRSLGFVRRFGVLTPKGVPVATCVQPNDDFHAGGGTIVTTLIVPKSGGVTSTKVNVVRWLKHEGEPVSPGEAVVELETEKVSYELESPAAGVLLKIVASAGTSEIPVGDPLGYIGQPGEAVPQS